MVVEDNQYVSYWLDVFNTINISNYDSEKLLYKSDYYLMGLLDDY